MLKKDRKEAEKAMKVKSLALIPSFFEIQH